MKSGDFRKLFKFTYEEADEDDPPRYQLAVR
jgi:hypothetical protein